MSEVNVLWQPQAGTQTAFIECPYKDVFFGGAAGGSKSDSLLGDILENVRVAQGAAHCIFIRRSFPQLEEIERRFIEVLAPHFGVKAYNKAKRTWNIPTVTTPATIMLRSIEKMEDAYKFLGHQFTVVAFDEVTQFPDDEVMELLFTRLRSPQGAPTRMRSASNPGGPGHIWVRDRYRIDDVEPRTPFPVQIEDRSTGEMRTIYHRAFIPSKLEDNQILLQNDPTYMDRLEAIADPILRRAYRDGDWSINQGAAFSEFDPLIHVVDDYTVPRGVKVLRSCDWGYDKPYAVGWAFTDFDGITTLCGELYGCGVKPNTGIQQSPEQVAELIRSIEKANEWDVHRAFLDPQCWSEHGGQPIFELLGGHKMRWEPWPKGKGSRIQQLQVCHEFLKVVNGKSRFRTMRRCKHFIRTVPHLPLDRTGQDIDTQAEDHLYDMWRGLLMEGVPTKEMVERMKEQTFRQRVSPLQIEENSPNDYGGW